MKYSFIRSILQLLIQILVFVFCLVQLNKMYGDTPPKYELGTFYVIDKDNNVLKMEATYYTTKDFNNERGSYAIFEEVKINGRVLYSPVTEHITKLNK